MYSKVALVVLFLAIVVLGVLLNKRPVVPDGFLDAGFCARKMRNQFDECKKFYFVIGRASSMFAKLSEDEQVIKLQEYIKADKDLRKDEPDTYPYKSPQEQYRAMELRMSGGKTVTATEASRATARLSSVCPSEAAYDAEGKIRLEPSGQTFSTMTDYSNHLLAFYAKNPTCKPIDSVKPYSGPQVGVLGGLGTSTPSPLQIAAERNDRTVVNQALADLFDKAGATRSTDGSIPVRTFQFPAPGEQTYAKTPINSLDDYEYNRVFELENRPRMAELSKQVKNNLLGAMQLDWPTLPYSSDTKAKLEEQFVDARMQDGFRDPKSGVFFKNMEGADIAPPNEDAAAAREAKILSGYQPTDITTHVVDDEYERVAKVVAQQYSTDPDWEPVVEKRGPHQYAVTELRPRRKKDDGDIVWEGEGAPTVAQAQQQGLLEGGEVKPNSMTIQDNLQDPFFAKTGVADHSNDKFWKYSDFNKWTPGLERMFAPTDPTNEWK